jgi:cellulose synthase/poly-beta-1,6-N-acetylglucosamine synthase-like glycosyltransferase
MSTLLFGIALICLGLAMHPFTTYPWSLIVLQALKPIAHGRRAAPAQSLDFAVCVCAYNEERVIERKIDNLLALRQRYPDLQILVYVDAATDRTAEILQRHSDWLELYCASERHGKTYGMNLLASRATASIVIFTDANVMMDIDCVQDFEHYFADPEIGCVCGNLNYTNSDCSITATSGSVYWRFEEAIKKLEAQTGSMMGADGSIFAIRRVLHQPPPDHLIDDLYVSLMILCSGYRVIQASNAHAYEESIPSASEEFMRKVRIACQAFNVHRMIWPHLRRLDRVTLYKYVSHKLLRWFTIYFLAGALLFFEAGLLSANFFAFGTAVPLSVLAAFALGHRGVKPFAQITDVIAAFAGTGVGVWRSIRGVQYQTWTPASSIRVSKVPHATV